MHMKNQKMKTMQRILLLLTFFTTLSFAAVAQEEEREMSGIEPYVEQELDTLEALVGLTPDERNRLKYRFLQSYQAMGNLQRWDESDRTKLNWYQKELEDDVAEVLGFAKYRKWQDYRKERREDYVMSRLKNYMESVQADVDLTDGQKKDLFFLFKNHYHTLRELKVKHMHNPPILKEEVDEQKDYVRRQVKKIMSPKQYQSWVHERRNQTEEMLNLDL